VKYATDAEVHEREVRTLRRAYNASEDERHRWIRFFNRLEAAISHHKNARGDFTDLADEALYKARDKILRDAASSGATAPESAAPSAPERDS
jgi:dsDNA-specific endonuclease/ATPase MutS2